MNLAFKYPIIFWNCACLISDAGGADHEIEEDEEVIDTLKQALAAALYFAAKSYLKDLKDGGKIKEDASRLDQLITKLQNTLQADK